MTTSSAIAGRPAEPAPSSRPAAAPHKVVLSPRLAAGLFGIFLAAMMAGFNNRVGALGLVDVRGALGFGGDEASWLNTAYAAGELVAMPFASWFAVTLSLRRFHVGIVGVCLLLAAVMPLAADLHVLVALRALQGLANGALIPILMMAALRYLPPGFRLYGLALYSMTATFAPNLAIWLTGQWVDQWVDWRLVYWHVMPLALASMALVSWGIPADQPQWARFRQANWFGCATGIVGLVLVTIGLDQGVRLDWFNSPLIAWALMSGLAVLTVYVVSEWHHPAPFMKLQLLKRRNLGLGFSIFVCLLVVMTSGASLPVTYLSQVWGFRALQNAPIGLGIALPQLIVAPGVAVLLYRKWADARKVFALGLALIALACLLGSQFTADWIATQFLWAQLLQCVGQPMAVVSMLFLGTGVVQPMEGPYVAGTINTLRALGVLLGGAMVGQLTSVRTRFHAEMLIDQAGLSAYMSFPPPDMVQVAGAIPAQALVLATADAYRVLGIAALLLVPLVMCLRHIPAPDSSGPSSSTSKG
jgi:DHA2 family multidrug resistance protein